MSGGSSGGFVGAEVDGLRELLRTLNKAPRELGRQLRQESKQLAEGVAADARRRASRANRQAAAAAPSIRAVADRVPAIRFGGAKRVTSSGTTKAGDIIFGSDWGSNRFRQFPKPAKDGRVIWPASVAGREEVGEAWLDAIERIYRRGA